ncbi:MAG TPA: hypothetical protein VH112_03605, partial [Acidimicrobiales bacterium]|nr:hypothetical protein [Acidimicrobiales bacterium]
MSGPDASRRRSPVVLVLVAVLVVAGMLATLGAGAPPSQAAAKPATAQPATAQPAPGTSSLHGVACPTVTTCEAVGYNASFQAVVVTVTNGVPGTAQVVSGVPA